MKKVFLETGALKSGHAHRGIGAYTRLLQAALRQEKEVQLVTKAEQSDVIHYPFFDFFQATLTVPAKYPVIVTIHDAIPLMYPKQYPAGIRGTLALWKQKWALKKVKAVITDSQASKKEVATKLGVPANKIKVVPLAADEAIHYRDLKEQQKATRLYDLPKDFILYVGDINYNKNLPVLLEAFSQVLATLPELKLVLLGKNFKDQPIPEWQAIKNTIEQFGLQKRVQFVTKVDSVADLAAIYSQARVYVQPSLAEGFGLPVLEAMQCHCPVICFKQSSLMEVGGEHAIYPTEMSPVSLAAAITDVYGWTGAVRHKWVVQAYSWSKTFSWAKTAHETAAIYQSL